MRFISQDIVIGYINIQSYKAHYQDLLMVPELKHCHAIGLGETWLNKEEDVTIFKDQAKVSINKGKGQGLAGIFPKVPREDVIVKHGLNFSFISFKINDHNIIFTYISTKAKFDDYSESLRELTVKNEPVILLGDTNVHASNASHAFMREMSKNGFQQQIKNATHTDTNILDHVHTNSYVDLKTVTIYQKPVIFSDHDFIFVCIGKPIEE